MSAFFLGHPKETDLALFAGGESGPFARWRVERHVERCAQCREITADFFRLPDQLNALADLPGLDWNQMAIAIESGVRADAASGRPARRSEFPPLMWQVGLAAATVVVAVIVLRYPGDPQPERELVASAPIEAPAPIALQQQAAQESTQALEQDTAAAEPVRDVPVVAEALAPAAKARAEKQTFASDIAAPAAPPPPAVLNAPVSRRTVTAAEPVAAAAESAEDRLRNDAASRVGAVSALADQTGAFRQARVAWVQLPVEAINFADAPLSLSSGEAAVAGAIAKTPSITATNRSGRTVSSFELVWIVGDGEAAATAVVQRQGISMSPGVVVSGGGDRSWKLPAGAASPKMRIYLSSVTFDDGTSWAPEAADIAGRGLISPGAGQAQLELLPLVIEGGERP
jgi:hypothetical protein